MISAPRFFLFTMQSPNKITQPPTAIPTIKLAAKTEQGAWWVTRTSCALRGKGREKKDQAKKGGKRGETDGNFESLASSSGAGTVVVTVGARGADSDGGPPDTTVTLMGLTSGASAEVTPAANAGPAERSCVDSNAAADTLETEIHTSAVLPPGTEDREPRVTDEGESIESKDAPERALAYG